MYRIFLWNSAGRGERETVTERPQNWFNASTKASQHLHKIVTNANQRIPYVTVNLLKCNGNVPPSSHYRHCLHKRSSNVPCLWLTYAKSFLHSDWLLYRHTTGIFCRHRGKQSPVTCFILVTVLCTSGSELYQLSLKISIAKSCNIDDPRSRVRKLKFVLFLSSINWINRQVRYHVVKFLKRSKTNLDQVRKTILSW